MRAPLVGVERARFWSRTSAIPILPTSCRSPAIPSCSTCVVGEAEALPDHDAERRDGLAVVARAGVLRVDRLRERGREQPLVAPRREQVGPGGRLRLQAGGVDDDPAAAPLGLVQGEVGVVHERVRALERRGLGDPAADAEDLAAAAPSSACRRCAKVSAPQARSSGQQHHELVAAGAVGAVTVPERRRQASATARIRSSPARWPSVSLTSFRPSRSSMTMLKQEPVRARRGELELDGLVEGAVVAEPGEAVAERRPARAGRPRRGALVRPGGGGRRAASAGSRSSRGRRRSSSDRGGELDLLDRLGRPRVGAPVANVGEDCAQRRVEVRRLVLERPQLRVD